MVETSLPLRPGDPRLIGGYRVLGRLGSGWQGQAFLATTQSGRHLTIRVVTAPSADFRKRFRSEIAAAQRVRHPSVAPVIDAHADAPDPWWATVHVPGPSLPQVVEQHGPLPPRALTILFAQLAEGLRAIHEADAVHGDLAPSSVILADDGPRIIDLGAVGNGGDDVRALGALMSFAATAREGDADLAAVPAPLRDLIERCLTGTPDLAEIIATLETPAPGTATPVRVTKAPPTRPEFRPPPDLQVFPVVSLNPVAETTLP
ncbi:protein kinase domain-containing protein [Spirillospora sp. CA-294931]|uniref:protein kinase domain-containing protein n=1 Tax=Spirillospora sp. CA-294931 TaxID=3240042 RepID=UPI003D9264B1